MAIDDLKVEGEEMESSLHVVYVKHMGTEMNGNNIYYLYISENPDDVFTEDWGTWPACNVPRKRIDIDEDMYSYVVELKSDIKLDLAQDCCCFTMQDSRDHIVALAYENLNNAEEYPEPRIIIQFGDNIEDVETMFAQRDITLKYI